MKFQDHEIALAIVRTTTEHVEHLGVCVAMFVGGAAMFRFSHVVFPLCAPVPATIGFLLGIAALFLAILVAYKTWHEITESTKSRWVIALALLVILVTNVFFVIAGAAAGIKALA